MLKRILKGGIVGLFASALIASSALAFSIEQIPTTPADGDYVVGPGKTEIRLDAGQTSIKNITVTNRYGQEMRYNIEIEDFGSPINPDETLVLMGAEKGPYSLRNFIKTEASTFVLQQGDRATIPVTIAIPEDATPGGLYGAVIVTTEPTDPLELAKFNEIKSGVILKQRIASLFFVRVNGNVKEEGTVINFLSDKTWYKNGPVKFSWFYQNTGNIYNSPYGVLEIKNLYGTIVDQISVEPYYVMPGSSRLTEKTWARDFMLGRYKATLQLNRGYGDKIDTKTIYFWVLPWKVIAGMLVGLFLILVIVRAIRKWFKKNFEYKGKNKKETPPSSAPQA
jgi:hypothetical protein